MADDVWTKDNVLSGLATKEQIDTLIQTNREVKSLLSDFMSFYRRDNWVEKISLRNEPQMLPLNGYRHIGIWVSEIDLPMTVNIGLPGIQSTSVELVAGLNALPDIDGMFISGSVGQIANVVRSNDPLTVSAATVLGQQGTLTNPVIIEQTGSLAPLTANAPTIILDESYTQFTNTTGYSNFELPGVLSRNARARTFEFYSTVNEPITTIDAFLYDSAIATPASQGWLITITTTALASGYPFVFTSEDIKELGAHVDSIALRFDYGTTTFASSGNLRVGLVEVK